MNKYPIYGGTRTVTTIDMTEPNVEMSPWKTIAALFLIFTTYCYALTCHSQRGGKEDEFKRVFSTCLKQVENNNSRNSNEDWSDWDRSYNQRNQQERDNRHVNRENKMGNRNTEKGEKDRNKNNRDDPNEWYDRQQNRDGVNENASNRMDDRYNRMDDRYNRMGTRNVNVNMNGPDSGNGRSRNEMMKNYGKNEQINGRDEFLQSEEFDADTPMKQDNYYPSPQPRRYRREKRVEMNSGQRSQYNPHSQKSNSQEGNHEKRNSSNSSNNDMDKACILHCFMEKLHMTGDSGMPDRYLVTHAFTKDEKDEDLRDFIQESIEECFQILNNENTEDKCEFSKNLLTCLLEKGRANCDDWNESTSLLLE